MQKLARVLLSPIVLIPFLCVPAQGASLSGVVVEEGEPVVAAEVRLVDADSRVILRSVSTGAQGSFRFPVNPGIFELLVFKSEYADSWSRRIAVGEADVVRRIELVPRAFAEEEQTDTLDDCNP